MVSGHGPYVTDADGREYVDLVCSWGPLLLGHAHPEVVEAVQAAAAPRHLASARRPRARSTLAEEIVARVAPVEQVRLVISRHRGDDVGDPAGPRLHRPHQVVKFAGCYHGHVDALLAAAGSGVATLGLPGLARRHRRAGGRHDRAALQRPRRRRARLRRARRPRSPASSPRPRAGNMGVVPPLRRLQRRPAPSSPHAHGALLILDEVMTGFRVSPVRLVRPRRRATPTCITFGKVMGGGLPAAAFGGRADIMARLAPAGPVYQAGTLSGNPLALRRRARHAAARRPTRSTPRVDAARPRASARWPPTRSPPRVCRTGVQHAGNLFSLFFTRRRRCATTTAPGARTRAASRRSSTRCSTRGVYLPPSAFEAWFVSAAHDDAALGPHRRRAAAAARAAAARRPEETADERRPRSSTCCGTARCTTRRRSSTAGCPATTSPSSAGRWPSASPSGWPARTSPTSCSSPLERAQETARADRRGARAAVATDDRLIEAGNVFEGKTLRRRRRLAAATRALVALRNPFRPSWGEPYVEIAERMLRGRRRGPRRRARATRRSASATSCRSGRCGRYVERPAALARPAQAAVRAGQPDVLHLRRGRAGLGVLRGAGARPAAGTGGDREEVRRRRMTMSRLRRTAAAAALLLGAAGSSTSCSGGTQSVAGQSYISGDGTVGDARRWPTARSP